MGSVEAVVLLVVVASLFEGDLFSFLDGVIVLFDSGFEVKRLGGKRDSSRALAVISSPRGLSINDSELLSRPPNPR